MKRSSFIKRLALVPIIACMATELAFSQPEKPNINGKKVMLYVDGQPIGECTSVTTEGHSYNNNEFKYELTTKNYSATIDFN